jgi:hypothetical protein
MNTLLLASTSQWQSQTAPECKDAFFVSSSADRGPEEDMAVCLCQYRNLDQVYISRSFRLMCFQSQSPRRCSLLEATKPHTHTHTHRFPPARCWDSTAHKPRHCDVWPSDTRRNSRALTLRWKGSRPDAVQVFDDRGPSTHLYRLARRRGGWRGLSLQTLGRSARPSVHVPVSQSTGPNVVDKMLPLLLRIREVPGSNLRPVTGYPD